MYGWLQEALHGPAIVLTASRRLARTLTAEFNDRQLAVGRSSWPTPEILQWTDWLDSLSMDESARGQGGVRLSGSQSRVLWERSLGAEIDGALLGRGNLVAEVREAWKRLHEWCVPLDECARAAKSRDHRLFVAASRRYSELLADNGWMDRAQHRSAVVNAVFDGCISQLPGRITLAGFDRRSAVLERLVAGLENAGSRVESVVPAHRPRISRLHEFESADAELRAAGSWARSHLENDAAARVAVVVPQLERDAPRMSRLLREALVPAWQLGGRRLSRVVNVSLGKKLIDYPGVAVASTLLQWVHEDISSEDFSRLLCSPLLGAGDIDARCRLDEDLRRRAWQHWTPEVAERWLARTRDDRGLDAWREALHRLAAERSGSTGRAMPADWAALFDTVLAAFGWPGKAALDSEGFQLVNRWRELLNELAQLHLVTGAMRAAEACSRLNVLAAETVFQPETRPGSVQLLGPLEAAGLHFDCLWIAGLSSSAWPPPSRPMALIPRDVQRRYGMPDADPADTAAYGRAILDRLAGSAADVTASYPRQRDDAEQAPSGLLALYEPSRVEAPGDPGWGAGRCSSGVDLVRVAEDPVPAVTPGELVLGGAAAIQRQLQEPFSAFVHGRLGVQPLMRLSPGVPAWFRGNLLHDVLRHLYSDSPARQTIASWDRKQCAARARDAAARAAGPRYRDTDALLRRLMELEEHRAVGLALQVLAVDCEREEFEIESIERGAEIVIEGVTLRLRIDRVDRRPDGGMVIWDYKTGRSRRFLGGSGDPDDYQLVVYAFAVEPPVTELGYFNVDSRAVTTDSAGTGSMSLADWERQLAQWQSTVRRAAAAIAGGDVRLNVSLADSVRRALAILSRYREADRD